MARKYSVALFILAVISVGYCWENLPNLPSGRRSQYFVIVENGGYKYGYDTGKDHFAKQAGDAQNQVEGHFVYRNPAGKDVDVKYTAGVQGYVPEGLQNLLPGPEIASAPVQAYAYSAPSSYSSATTSDDQSDSGDASYSFTIDTDSYKREEASDASGNVKGSYSYTNKAGQHDLSYIAGSGTGFVATSGSLSVANGLGSNTKSPASDYPTGKSAYVGPPANLQVTGPNEDGSYSFEYSTDDHSRQESSDSSGNVQGKYSFSNPAGTHDLSYVAGPATGFQLTGGSLSIPNGLNGKIAPAYSAPQFQHSAFASAKSFEPATGSLKSNEDGSYSFEYSTSDQSREESSDRHGNVKGRYSFKNEAGNHDLSYVAGSETGFLPLSGSLSIPNGLTGSSVPSSPAVARTYLPPTNSNESQDDQAGTGDASYSFTIDTDEYKRQENSDAQGNVKGQYSYTNKEGSHDLSYVAGSATGFLPTGGSLSLPNAGVDVPVAQPVPSSRYIPVASSTDEDDETTTGDASYSFNIDTDEYKRQETSDAQGNVKGSYSYKNIAGSHDLSYTAGLETGFQATGGSLSLPNGLGEKSIPLSHSPTVSGQYLPPAPYSSNSSEDEASSGDASYSFNIDTPEYKRTESSDAQGNIKGSYSYTNVAGSHDLSYTAGSNTGFLATGGSLSAPNGIARSQEPSPGTAYLPPQSNVKTNYAPVAHLNLPYRKDKFDNIVVKTYAPTQLKHGYIFESL